MSCNTNIETENFALKAMIQQQKVWIIANQLREDELGEQLILELKKLLKVANNTWQSRLCIYP